MSLENFSTNFKENEIKLVFDETLSSKLKQAIVISPPMKHEPLIGPTSAK
jgi:hypothetical protein